MLCVDFKLKFSCDTHTYTKEEWKKKRNENFNKSDFYLNREYVPSVYLQLEQICTTSFKLSPQHQKPHKELQLKAWI